MTRLMDRGRVHRRTGAPPKAWSASTCEHPQPPTALPVHGQGAMPRNVTTWVLPALG